MMNYFTGMASPMYEFPYSNYQAHSIPNFDNDINSILSQKITPLSGDLVYNQPAAITLQCVPQINTGVGNNTVVYQVPENTPIETILQQLGINTNTLQPSSGINNYYTAPFQPMEIYIAPSSHRRRRLVCHEVSDSDDDSYFRRPSHHDHQQRQSISRPTQSQQSPVALHDLLSKVWHKAERGSSRLPASSSSAPNTSSQWRSRQNSPSPQNYNANTAWQAMRNVPPSMSQDHQNAINRVWNKAEYASELSANRFSNMPNRMQQPTGGAFQPPPPQNREAVHDFFAARNLPNGITQPPPPQNREAVHDFLSARNLPYGINTSPPPPQNREAVHDFFAARKLPYGINTSPPPPPQNREAVHDFFAARNLPYGINQPNPTVASVWNRAEHAVDQRPPPMNNIPWNQMPRSSPSPVNATWNRMQQGSSLLQNPSYPNPPTGFPQRGAHGVPAPTSFAALLSQAHRQNLPYTGVA